MASQRYDIVYSLCHVYPVDIYRMSDGIHRHWMRVRHPGAPGRWFKYLTSLIHPAMVWLEGRLFSGGNCRLFVTNSRLVKGQVMKIFGIQADRIRVIYNGVDHAVFNSGVRRFRGEMRRKAGIGEGELVLLFVANNWERKGLSTVIRAAAKSRAGNLRIVVIGRGREERFRLLAAREGLRPDALHFPGHTREVEKWYGMADFFVLPTMYEPFANVCLEAMACGLPCITTRTNGAAELIRDGENGFVLERWDDSDGLSEMIGKLGGSDFRLSMGEHAAKEAGLYTWERHIRETEELFEYYIRSRRN